MRNCGVLFEGVWNLEIFQTEFTVTVDARKSTTAKEEKRYVLAYAMIRYLSDYSLKMGTIGPRDWDRAMSAVMSSCP
jgi:hypothetical protein